MGVCVKEEREREMGGWRLWGWWWLRERRKRNDKTNQMLCCQRLTLQLIIVKTILLTTQISKIKIKINLFKSPGIPHPPLFPNTQIHFNPTRPFSWIYLTPPITSPSLPPCPFIRITDISHNFTKINKEIFNFEIWKLKIENEDGT